MKSSKQRGSHQSRLKRSSPKPLALEARMMFDGAAVDTAAAAIQVEEATAPHTGGGLTHDIAEEIVVLPSAADSTRDGGRNPGEVVCEYTLPGARQLSTGNPAANGGRNEIAFIDSSIDGWTQLAESMGPGVEVVLIDANEDGLMQMADYLEGRTGLDAIHVVAHGREADATFGAMRLSNDNLAQHQADLARVGAALSSQGDLLLYGCDIGKGVDGANFIGKIAEATGADVAASSDATGSASKGGDWVLEERIGSIEVRSFDLSNASTPDFLLGPPSVTSVDDMTYTEGSGAVVVDSNITITGGVSYDGQYIRFGLTNGQTTDTLGLNSAANVNASGAISISGVSVYLGNGSGRDIIGTVDGTENGQNGQALRINFVSTFTNSSFESGLAGWTALNQRIDLGVTSIAGFTSPNDATNPANAGNDNVAPTTLGTLTTTSESGQATEGTRSARLASTGMQTATGFDIVHGPAIYSDVFSATAGDAIYFDWRALAGSDAYDVFGYLLNTTTGATTEVLNATGTSTAGTTNWATASASIPTSGTYRFVFVSGTYDFSGGRAAGASLYIDNVRVFGSKVNDTVVSNLARQVTFASSSDNPLTSPTRVFTVTAMSATSQSGSDTGLINITVANDAPVLSGAAQVLNYTENAAATPIDTAIVVADPDSPANFNGGYMQAQVTTNGAAEDQLSVLHQGSAAGQIGVSGSNVTYGGVNIGTIDGTLNGANNAALRINLNSNATVAATQALARVISYRNTSDAPSVAARIVTFTVNDGGNTGTGSAMSGTRTATVNVAAVDDPAVLTLSTAASNYTENDGSYFVDPNLTITDVDTTTMNGARVVIGTGFRNTEDTLAPATGTNADGITYSYNATTGVLTLTGNATIAQYQTALRAVRYSNSSDNPDTTARTITFTLGNTVALTIGGINHYYEVVTGPLSWTNALTAAEGRTFQGLTGYLATITSQTENDFIQQKLTADAWIGASDAFAYINAATGATTYANQGAAEGHWYWVSGPESGTRISDGNGSPVTFAGSYSYWNSGEPNNVGGAGEHYGQIYSTGSTGRWNDLPNSSTLAYVVEYSDLGGTPAFSKSIQVTPVRVNDAPVASGAVAMTSINENATTNSGQLISGFLSATDPDTNPVTGVAITGLSSSNGTWQYSTDGGAAWTNIGSVSTSSALLLRSTDRVRFIPDGLNADSASITYKAWDRSNENGVSIVAGQRVSVTSNGGITAYSSGNQTASITVIAVNDAPTMSAATPALTGIDENAVANGGELISSVLGASVSDSDTGAQQGIAITSLSSGNGTWEYSTNGGGNWTAVGTVSASSALLLRDTDLIRFRPDGNNGTTASFAYRAWDRTSGTQGTKVNASVGGTTTAFSTASNTASISISSVNDAPVLSGAALSLATISEDNAGSAGQTVSSLLAGTLSDVDLGAVQGIAITAATVAGTGHWEYDTGSGWTTLNAVTSNAALLLRSTDKLRYVPDLIHGGTPTLTVRGWDTTTGTAGSTADTTTNGGSTAFSAATATASITVTEINDAPIFTTAADAASFTEMSSAVTVGANLVLTDDGANLKGATVRIQSGFTPGDTLAVGTPGGLSVSYNSATGVLTLSGTASVATYQAALRSVTFVTTSEDPTSVSTTRTLQWQATDSANATSTSSTSTLTLTPTVDAPTITNAPANWGYVEDDGARNIAPTLLLSDLDDTQLSGATVRITGTGYLDDGFELLAAVITGTNIQASFDGSTGTLTLSNVDSVANYQKVLRSITYINTRDYNNPSAVGPNDFDLDGSNNTRTFSWQVTDANSDGANGSPTYGAEPSAIPTTLVTLYNANETPQIDNVLGNSVHIAYTEGGAPATLEGSLDVHDDGLVSSITSAFVRVTNGLEAGDVLGFFSGVSGWTQTGTPQSGTLDNNAGTVITYDWSLASGDMTLTTTSGTALQADYTAVMQQIGFVSTSDDPTASNATRTMIWRVTDSGGLQSAVTAAQTTIIDITAVDDAPTVTGLPADGDVVFIENGSDVALAAGFTLADPDDTRLLTATVELSGVGFLPTREYLSMPSASVTAGSDWSVSNIGGSGVDASYVSATGVLTLTSVSAAGVDVATMQALLRQVQYGSVDDNPTVAATTRTLTWTATDVFGSRVTDVPAGNDGDAGVTSSPTVSTVTLSPRNDAPTLSGSGNTAVYTEGGGAIAAAPNLLTADEDDTQLSSARVWISSGFSAGDTLNANTPGGLVVNYNGSTGELTLSGAASQATYRDALRSIVFSSTNDDPTGVAGSRVLSWQVTDNNAAGDGALASSVVTTNVDITAVDDSAVVAGLPANGTTTFTENGSSVSLAPSLTLSDSDDTHLAGATVTIAVGATAGDLLSIAASLTGTGISLDPSSTDTTLVLTGLASLSDYRAILRSITFSSTSDNPAGASSTRTIVWTTTSAFDSRLTDATGANDASSGAIAPVANSQVTITGLNDAPTVVFDDGTPGDATDKPVFQQGSAPIFVVSAQNPNTFGGLTVSDSDDANIASASVQITDSRSSDDVLSIATPPGWNRVGSVYSIGGNSITVAYDGGTGTLSLSGTATKAQYSELLGYVQYQNATSAPTATGASRELTWTVTDANASGTGALSVIGNTYLVIRDINDAPQIAPPSSTVNYTEGAASVALTDIVITDTDPGEVVTATLTLTNTAAGTLTVPAGAAYDGGTGVWTITGTVANVNIALAAVAFVPSADNDVNTTITVHVADGGEDGAVAATGVINLNVTAVNDAPTLTPVSPVLGGINEDATNNAGYIVSTFRGAVTDVDTGATVGIAITGLNSGNGAWQYSIDGGTTWTNVGSVSATNALLLRDSDLVRFVPNGENGTAPTFDYRAWDRSSGSEGTKVDASLTGNAAEFSTTSDTASLAVASVNDAPVLVAGNTTLSDITEDDTANAGYLLSTLLAGKISDVDAGASQGIAITGLSSGNGTWQYSIDGGATWTTATASASASLLLRDTDHLRFVPNGENATAASFTYRAWDRSVGAAGGAADTSTVGASAAFSSVENAMSLNATAVNDAPVLAAAAPSFATLTEDDAANPGQTVATLVGATISDVDSGALEGIAVTSLINGNGAWQYSLDSGATWSAIGVASQANALLLRSTDLMRFVPNEQNDTSGSFSYRAWDLSTGTAGASADVTISGGTTAFSSNENNSTIVVTAVNDAPALATATPVLPTLTEDDLANAGVQITTLLGATITDVDTGAVSGIAITGLSSGNGTWQYSLDGGSTWSNVGTVSTSSALQLRDTDYVRFVPDGDNATTASFNYRAWDRSIGTAGTSADTTTSGGTTAFSSGVNTASVVVTAVNDAPILSAAAPQFPTLTEDDQSNAGQTVATLVGATIADADSGAVEGIALTSIANGNGRWQYSQDGGATWSDIASVSSTQALLLSSTDSMRFVPDGENATAASFTYRAWDRSVGSSGATANVTTNGGTTAFSSGENTASVTVTAVNDSPALGVDAPLMPTLTEDEVANAGLSVATVIGSTIADVDAGTPQGVAITGLSSGNGTWQYSIDGGTTWLDVGAVSVSNALQLRSSDLVRFRPDGNNATTASFTYQAWDQSSGTAGARGDASAGGGTASYSSGSNTASITITAINDAPILAAAAPQLTTLTEDNVDNNGQSVADFVGITISDADSGSLRGIALTGIVNGNGRWQYSLDAGTTWTDIASASDNEALLLTINDRIRFVPDAENATTGSFTYRAWDRSAGTAGSTANASTNGGVSAFSANTNTASITITAVNDAPINDIAPIYTGGARGDGTLRQDGVVTGDPRLWHDVDAGDPSTTFTYQWQVADDAAGTNLRNVSGATASSYTLTAAEIGLYVRLRVTGSDGQTTTDAFSSFARTTNNDPTANVALIAQTTSQSVPLTYTVPTTAFVDADPEDTLYYTATLTDGSPLPSWLSFDPLTRTFTGTPSGGDVGVVNVRVTASDHGNVAATSDFALTVLSLPLNPDQPTHVPNDFVPLAPNLDPLTPITHTDAPFIQRQDTLPLSIDNPGTATQGTDSHSFVPTFADAGRTGYGRGFSDADATRSLTRADGFRIVVEPTRGNEIALLLVRPLADAYSKPSDSLETIVPIDTFSHTQSDAVITLSAIRTDGKPLPRWLRFDSMKGRFYGTAPEGFDGDIEVKVTARDNFGNEASTTFRFRIHKEAEKRALSGKPSLDRIVKEQGSVHAPRYAKPGTARVAHR
jgi:hypothetical protein